MGTKAFEIDRPAAGGKVMVSGTFEELAIDKEIECSWNGARFVGIVETRYSGGAIVRLVQPLQPR